MGAEIQHNKIEHNNFQDSIERKNGCQTNLKREPSIWVCRCALDRGNHAVKFWMLLNDTVLSQLKTTGFSQRTGRPTTGEQFTTNPGGWNDPRRLSDCNCLVERG